MAATQAKMHCHDIILQAVMICTNWVIAGSFLMGEAGEIGRVKLMGILENY